MHLLNPLRLHRVLIRTGKPRLRKNVSHTTPDVTTHIHTANEIIREKPAFATTRLPLALMRVFGAECFLCRGIGCEECAHTGLR